MSTQTFSNIVDSLHEIYGNHSAAARALSLPPRTYRDNRKVGRFKRPQTHELALRLISENVSKATS